MANEATPKLLKDLGAPIFPMTHKDLVQGLSEALAGKQAVLVSGENIKTINGQSILGSGNIVAGGGSGDDTYTKTETDALLDEKVDKVTGKGLSTNDFTNANKEYLEQLVPLQFYQKADKPVLYTPYNIAQINEIGDYGDSGKSFSDLATAAQGAKADTAYQKPASGIPASDLASGVIPDVSGLYTKPAGGIPKTDLAAAVQSSLSLADSALQSFTETDPTVPSWAKQSSKPSYTAQEVGALPANTPIPDAVEANPTVPSGTTPTALTGLKIGSSYYSAPSVAALTNSEIDTIWANAT